MVWLKAAGVCIAIGTYDASIGVYFSRLKENGVVCTKERKVDKSAARWKAGWEFMTGIYTDVYIDAEDVATLAFGEID